MARVHSHSRPACALLLGLLAALASSCQTIAGIEDRELDPNAGTSALCSRYCDVVMENCQQEFQVYATRENCIAVCAKLPAGDDTELAPDDTVACRLNQAQNADREPDVHCPSAGPGGGELCGGDCEAYCELYPAICAPEYPNVAACKKACGGLIDQSTFDVNANADYRGDTLECRLVHLSSAALKPSDHCPHARVEPTEPCAGAPDESPTCEQYCTINLAACTGELMQYRSMDQCLNACGAFEPGANDDEQGNTMACRRYHSFSATKNGQAALHCPHSGPTGDGHCGNPTRAETGATGNCDSYCLLAKAACEDAFTEKFPGETDCNDECIGLTEAEPNSLYSVASAEESSGLQCRVLHAVLAFEEPSECEAALGAAPCDGD